MVVMQCFHSMTNAKKAIRSQRLSVGVRTTGAHHLIKSTTNNQVASSGSRGASSPTDPRSLLSHVLSSLFSGLLPKQRCKLSKRRSQESRETLQSLTEIMPHLYVNRPRVHRLVSLSTEDVKARERAEFNWERINTVAYAMGGWVCSSSWAASSSSRSSTRTSDRTCTLRVPYST